MPLTKGTPESIKRILDASEKISHYDNYYDPKENTQSPATLKYQKAKKQTVLKAKTKSKGKNVETEMEVKKDITDKIKSAIKKSVIVALENELKDTELLYDSSSSDKKIVEEELILTFPDYTLDEELWFFDKMEYAIKHGDKPEEVGGIPYEILNKFKNQYKTKSKGKSVKT